MSGILKSIGKVFKKILKSPIFKVIAIAVAVYFTAGLAMGAAGSAFAAGLPGISGAADALGITAGAFGADAAGVAGAALGSVGVTEASAAALTQGAAGIVESGGLEAAAGGAAGVVDSGLAAGAGAATDAGALVGSGAASTAGVDAAAAGATDAGALVGSGAASTAGVDAAGAATDAATQAVDAGAGLGTTASDVPALDTNIGGLTPGQAGAGPQVTASPGDSFGASGSQMPGNTIAQYGATPSGSVASQATGGNNGLMQWWKGLDPTTQKLAYQGLSESAKAVINGIAQKSNIDAIQKQRDQERADIIRRGGVPDLTASYRPAGGYKTPGIINSGTGGA